ncbi:MAG: ABC transporter permease subunit [Gemmatimonadota bacterium]|nr:MAG: ABC transporter permease subunit [Gemmatimonadota bacterium]
MRGTGVRAIYGLEIRSLLRDRRTVFVSIVLPVVLMPLLLLASSRVERSRQQREESRHYKYAVVGSDSTFMLELLGDSVRRDGGEPADSAAPTFETVPTTDALNDLESRAIEFFVESLGPEEWRAFLAEDTARADELEDFHDTPVARVNFRSNRRSSSVGARQLRTRLAEIRRVRRDSVLVEAGFPIHPENLATLDVRNVASAVEVAGARLGRMLTLFVVLLMMAGGGVLATDTLAGEKERGTLVTLLTTGATRAEIIWAKLVAVTSVALVIVLIQIVNLWIYLGLGLIDVSSGFSVSVAPATALVLFVLYVPVAALASGILLITSAYAKTYKEAQLLFMPAMIGLLLPTLAPFLPEVSLSSAIVLVPLANVAIAARDVLVGQANWLMIGIAWLVTAAAAAYAGRIAARALEDENLVAGADSDRAAFLGGPALFRKRVLHWFVVFWAVKILLEMNIAFDDIRWTALFHVGVVFLAAPLLMVWHFKLDIREALALRAPKAGVWLGVVLGAPAALIVVTGFFQLVNLVLPMPRELLENFGQAILPEGIPVWQIVIFLSVIPGIVEELTFRGALLHGLRRRFSPVVLSLVVGGIFGFFHFQIFRIPSTAVLGVILAGITVLTGSIFPAMLWHAINNALALYLGSEGVDLGGGTWMTYASASVALALALWIVWLNRSLYPDLKGQLPSRGAHEHSNSARPEPPG